MKIFLNESIDQKAIELELIKKKEKLLGTLLGSDSLGRNIISPSEVFHGGTNGILERLNDINRNREKNKGGYK